MASGPLVFGQGFEPAHHPIPHFYFGDPCAVDTSRPNTERRPPNAFILFSRSARPSIQTGNPGLNNIEYTRILAQVWKALPEPEKMVFQRQAAEMQSQFKLLNPHYSYKKVPRKEKAVTAPQLPQEFRWEQMLNHQGFARSSKT
jgi:hypothetical protein